MTVTRNPEDILTAPVDPRPRQRQQHLRLRIALTVLVLLPIIYLWNALQDGANCLPGLDRFTCDTFQSASNTRRMITTFKGSVILKAQMNYRSGDRVDMVWYADGVFDVRRAYRHRFGKMLEVLKFDGVLRLTREAVPALRVRLVDGQLYLANIDAIGIDGEPLFDRRLSVATLWANMELVPDPDLTYYYSMLDLSWLKRITRNKLGFEVQKRVNGDVLEIGLDVDVNAMYQDMTFNARALFLDAWFGSILQGSYDLTDLDLYYAGDTFFSELAYRIRWQIDKTSQMFKGYEIQGTTYYQVPLAEALGTPDLVGRLNHKFSITLEDINAPVIITPPTNEGIRELDAYEIDRLRQLFYLYVPPDPKA